MAPQHGRDAHATLTPAQERKARMESESLIHAFLVRLQNVKVLDPACGSGNFLYVTLQALKDLEKEVIVYSMENGLGSFLPLVGPWQLFGIEINPYAHDLAQMTVWIGWLQWIRARRTLQHACGNQGSAYGGLALSYLFGLGTDPLEKDSDDDGLEDGDEVNTWHTDPLVNDTDKDGLEDGDEATLGTSPTNPDTDGDGMTDGWEAGHSLDPLSADGVDGASGDPDTDGLPNVAEFRAGTDPHGGDWDNDTVLDGDEAAWWETAVQLPWFGVSGGTSVLHNVNSGYGLIPASLPFPVRIGGAVCTNALLDVNGVAYFIDRLKPVESGVYSRNSNSVLTNNQPLTDNHFAVAAQWDDLYARAAAPATRVTVADVATNGVRYCVIEYRDMGFSSNSSARVSFQIVIPENGTNTVCVRYADVAGANTGGAATLGAQGPGAAINIPVSFNRPFITNGLTLAYHFGSGGSPFVKDTDGDGLEDGAEVALGTSPANPDSDGDGLPDKWEAGNALNPLSASGNDGADGDPDGDGLLNRDEFEHNADPREADMDEDGLTDLEEVGGVTLADIPWFDLSGGENLTPRFSNLDYSCLTVPLAAPTVICGAVFTNLTLDINGLAYLNPTGYQNTAYSSEVHDDMEGGAVDENALTLAPFWADLIAVTNTAPASKILSGTATDGTNLYRVIEYRNMRIETGPVSTNNMVSFQVAIPTGATDRVFVRYALASGNADGRYASVGHQELGGTQKDSWCFDQAGRVRSGLSLALVIGTGTAPRNADTDNDELSDAEELALGTDPLKQDTDGDRLPDGWELNNVFNPLVNNDTDGIEGNCAEDDPDDDGLSNFDEYLNGTYPDDDDSDDDETNDGDEVAQGSDPNDPSDNGQPPPPDDILELPFHITGDYAAWEMTVEGLGPGDTRVFKLSTDAPGDEETVTIKLLKGNSYRLTMNWLGSGEHTDPYWYCWEAQIDELPAAQAYDNPDSYHSAVRVPGVAETVSGDGWFAQNTDGLLTTHVHSSGNGSGNIAGELEAILYVPKVTVEEMNFVNSGGTSENNNFDIANDAGTATIIPVGDPEWTSSEGMIGETVYIRNRQVRADVKLKITPVIAGVPLELELYSTGDLDFTPSGTSGHTVNLTFDATGYSSHTFTTHTKKTVDHLERKEYAINWQGCASTTVKQFIYTLNGVPVDNGPGTVPQNQPRQSHLKYLLGPTVNGEGNWCHLKSTLNEKTSDSIVYAVYNRIIADGEFNHAPNPPPLSDLWQIVSGGTGGVCLEFAKLMKEALLVAGVPESSLVARSVISKQIREGWLGGAGKTVLAAFKEDAGGVGTTWINQGVCGVNTADNGWRYYDLTGPGVSNWETGSGGWSTPEQPNTPGPNNLWYENIPVTAGPVIKRFTETYGTWSPSDCEPHDADGFNHIIDLRSQIVMTGTDPWVGDNISLHYRTEGVLNVGVKVEVTLYKVVGESLVEIDLKEQGVACKWNNNQHITFTVAGSSGETFQFYARILKPDGTTMTNAWIDPGSPLVVTTKP